MPQDVHEWAWLVLFITIVVVRKAHERRAGQRSSLKGIPALEAVLMLLWGLFAGVAPLFFIFGELISFADYPFTIPPAVSTLGVALFVLAIWLLHRAHADLGKHWSPTVAFRNEHALVTEGVYRKCRHPMYTAHVIWGVAQTLLLPNLIAGPLALITVTAALALRIPREERAILEEFGNGYRLYMDRTGRMFPKLSTRPPQRD